MTGLSLYLANFTLPAAPVDPVTARPGLEPNPLPPIQQPRSAYFQGTDTRNALEVFAELYPDCVLESLLVEVWVSGDAIPEPELEDGAISPLPAPAEASAGSLDVQLEPLPAFQLEDGPAMPEQLEAAGQAGELEELAGHQDGEAAALEAGELQEFEQLTPEPGPGKNPRSLSSTLRARDLAAAIGQARASGGSMIRQGGAVLWTARDGITEAGARAAGE